MENESIKVVMLGECGVGKTSIITRFVSDQITKDHYTTVGAAFKTQSLFFTEHNMMVKFNIWDTAGQEKFHSMIKVFYRDAGAIILTYSITNRESFEGLKNYWYPEIQKECGKDIILCVAANKSDLYIEEEVSEEEGIKFAEKINAFFIMTSALTKNGIEDLFKCIGTKYLPSNETLVDGSMTNNDNKGIILSKNCHTIKENKCCS